MLVGGADGFPRGWVVVTLDDDRVDVACVGRFTDVLAALPAPAVVGVDMPMGLPTGADRRPCDLAAREFVGPRRASVFPAPPLAVLEAEPYAAAVALSTALVGSGISRQCYALRSKIRELDGLARPDRARVYEVFPEASFRAMAGEVLKSSKRTWNGLMARRRLLTRAGVVIPDHLGAAGLTAADDIVDAAAVAWTARRIARGEAATLPADPPVDAHGRPIAIWY